MKSEDTHPGAPWRLVLWPAGVTLAVTLLRCAGELLEWSPVVFNRAAGGGAAPVGIIWLIPVFGFYFGPSLVASERRAVSLARAGGVAALALAVLAGFVSLGLARPVASPSQFVAIGAGSWIAILTAWRGWPALVATLLRYGVLARVPVVLVILLAILGDWQTHYDTPPPGLPQMGALARWIAIGVIPQLTLWLAVTVVFGLMFGTLGAVLASSRNVSRAVAAGRGREEPR